MWDLTWYQLFVKNEHDCLRGNNVTYYYKNSKVKSDFGSEGMFYY